MVRRGGRREHAQPSLGTFPGGFRRRRTAATSGLVQRRSRRGLGGLRRTRSGQAALDAPRRGWAAHGSGAGRACHGGARARGAGRRCDGFQFPDPDIIRHSGAFTWDPEDGTTIEIGYNVFVINQQAERCGWPAYTSIEAIAHELGHAYGMIFDTQNHDDWALRFENAVRSRRQWRLGHECYGLCSLSQWHVVTSCLYSLAFY